MSSILIVYGSTTGNTEYVADTLEQDLAADGHSVVKANADNIEAAGLCDKYEVILFGCSTWGDDSIELQDDFIPLFDEFDSINASGKTFGVFGCGDSSYEYFCGAVDAIQEKLVDMGGTVVDTLKIDGEPQAEKDNIIAFGKAVLKAVA